MNSSMDKAKHFFAESGILGPTNFKDSRDLIRKTSTIHIDTSLKNQVRANLIFIDFMPNFIFNTDTKNVIMSAVKGC